MPEVPQWLGYTAAQNALVTLKPRQFLIITDRPGMIAVHDGVTPGGHMVGGLSGSNVYVLAALGATPTENGTSLLAAYAAAKAFSPNGVAKSATNRACVLIPPGVYDLGNVELTLDTQYVDIAGISPDAAAVLIRSTFNGTDKAAIKQTVNDVHISNLSAQANGTYTGTLGELPLAAYKITNTFASARLTNVRLLAPTASNPGKMLTSASAGEFAGRYERVFGDGVLFSGQHGAAGGVLSGIFLDCESTGAFGGAGSTCSGEFRRCKGTFGSFGSDGTFSGVAYDCFGGDASFGGSLEGSGTFSGKIYRCVIGNGSCGWRLSGNGFTNTGRVYYCTQTTGTIQTPSTGGKIILSIEEATGTIRTATP